MQIAISLGFFAACMIGCSGTAGVREQSHELVVATHCSNGRCAARPEPRHLGDGCYAVHDAGTNRNHLYDCTTDHAPAGAATCIDVTPCTGACKQTVTLDGREIPIDRCEARWRADREAHRAPRRCSPSLVQVVMEPPTTTPMASSPLTLPAEVVMEVSRSGKSRVVYTAESCASADGIVVKAPTRSSGFPTLDVVLHQTIGEHSTGIALGGCAVVTLLVSRFECEVDQVSL